MQHSILKQERLKRGWSYETVEAKIGIPQRSQENAENGYHFPRQRYIELYCNLYGKSAEELGLVHVQNCGRITVGNINAPTSQEETPIMSDLIRRFAVLDLGSYLIGLVSAWPRHNRHYGELQAGINKAIVDHGTLVGQDAIAALNRRQALMSLGVIPIQLMGDRPITDAKKADTDTLLPHCAAGIAGCWYLRRGKDLIFISDLISSYISLLQPLMNSKSEAHRKASAELLAQSFRLKASLSRSLENEGKEEHYYLRALDYAARSGNGIEQAIANRILAADYFWHGQSERGLPYARTAYGLMKRSQDMPGNVKSYIASGLSLCQAGTGHPEDAKISLKEALNLFDPSAPIPSMPYSEAILTAVSAAVHQYSENWGESIELYEKSLTIPDISVLGALQCRINYAKAEVSRDDIQTRDMGLCIKLVTETSTGATELDSERYKREARECYNLLRVAWRREDAIKKLGRDHFGLK